MKFHITRCWSRTPISEVLLTLWSQDSEEWRHVGSQQLIVDSFEAHDLDAAHEHFKSFSKNFFEEPDMRITQGDIPYTADEAYMVLIETVTDWRKLIAVGQGAERIPQKKSRQEWLTDFAKFFAEREDLGQDT